MDINSIDKKSAAIGAGAMLAVWIVFGCLFGGSSCPSTNCWYNYGNGAVNLNRVVQYMPVFKVGPNEYPLSAAGYEQVKGLKDAKWDSSVYVSAYLKFDEFPVYVLSQTECKSWGDFKDAFNASLDEAEKVEKMLK